MAKAEIPPKHHKVPGALFPQLIAAGFHPFFFAPARLGQPLACERTAIIKGDEPRVTTAKLKNKGGEMVYLA